MAWSCPAVPSCRLASDAQPPVEICFRAGSQAANHATMRDARLGMAITAGADAALPATAGSRGSACLHTGPCSIPRNTKTLEASSSLHLALVDPNESVLAISGPGLAKRGENNGSRWMLACPTTYQNPKEPAGEPCCFLRRPRHDSRRRACHRRHCRWPRHHSCHPIFHRP